MLRALRIGLFIGTLIGMSACAAAQPSAAAPVVAISAHIG
jgi:hypothetical protein